MYVFCIAKCDLLRLAYSRIENLLSGAVCALLYERRPPEILSVLARVCSRLCSNMLRPQLRKLGEVQCLAITAISNFCKIAELLCSLFP
jgi:hypothetical protein